MPAITRAGPADRTALMSLLADMAQHYGEQRDIARLAAAAEALTTPGGRAGPFCLVARRGDVAVGFASLSGFFPAFDLTWGLLLKDIYVAGTDRGTGIGRALMTEVTRFAVAEGYTRVDWTTDGTNGRARAFYAGLGVETSGKIFYRLTGSALVAASCGHWPAEETAR
jgi:GNAT superfamily N-acetyltransferase